MARFHAPGVTVVAFVPSAGPVPPPMIVVIPVRQRLLQELRADEVHVAVDAAGGEDLAVAGEDLGRRADHERGVDAVHRVGVAGLADADDAAVAHADVGLHHAPVVEDHRAGDHEVGRALGTRRGRLAHRLADDLAAAEHGFVAAGAVIDLDLDEQVGVGQADAVARGRAVQRGRSAHARRASAVDRSSAASSSGPRDLAPQPGDDAPPAERDQVDRPVDAGLEAHRRARRDREPAPARGDAVEGSAGLASAKW